MSAIRVLVIDLNNFARYPTIAVGYLASILRASDIAVTVYSPLAHGVPGIERDQPETILRSMGRRLSYLLAARPNPLISAAAGAVSAVRDQWAKRDFRRIVAGFDAIDPNSYDVVLISAYLMYRDVCEAMPCAGIAVDRWRKLLRIERSGFGVGISARADGIDRRRSRAGTCRYRSSC